MTSNTKTIGVAGTGVIGASWALLFLSHGHHVIVTDPAPSAETKFVEFLDEHWATMEGLGLHPSASRLNYKFVKDITPELASLDFVQENAPEREQLKKGLLATITAGLRSDIVVASSSSGLPSSSFVQDCTHPERVLIGHPFNPPHLIPLVEVVPHPGTSQEAVSTASEFYKSLGKAPVVLREECPGFIANRLQAVLMNEAYSLVSRGLVSAADLDVAVTDGLGLRWAAVGPFMTNALAGGGGVTGFEHAYVHLGTASKAWTADSKKHEYDLDDAKSKQTLVSSVSEMLQGKSIPKIEQDRDTLIAQIIA